MLVTSFDKAETKQRYIRICLILLKINLTMCQGQLIFNIPTSFKIFSLYTREEKKKRESLNM